MDAGILGFEATQRDEGYVLALIGEADVTTAKDLEAALQTAVHATAGEVIVDLSRLSFIDSSGIRALLRGRGWAADLQKTLVVRSPTDSVRRILQITAVDFLVQSEPS